MYPYQFQMRIFCNYIFSMEQESQDITIDERRKEREAGMTPLAIAMEGHPSNNRLNSKRMEILAKYMDDSHKGKNSKELRVVAKNFIQRCPAHLQELLTQKMEQEFFKFLKYQKELDDQKLRKLSTLADEWQESKRKKKNWKAPLKEYLQLQKEKADLR